VVHKSHYRAPETSLDEDFCCLERRPLNGLHIYSGLPSSGAPRALRETSAEHPRENPFPTRARDNRIKDKDNKSFRRAHSVYDGIDLPYLLEELMVRYNVDFVRTPVNERCVFCNATYAGETKVKLTVDSYAVSNHVWLVDFYRANNVDFSEPKEGLLMIWSKKWRNAGLGDPKGAFVGLCAVTGDRGRNIIVIETNLEAIL